MNGLPHPTFRHDVEAGIKTIVSASFVAVRVDVGLQQTRNSTLNTYLETLLFQVTGNFAERGCSGLHTWLATAWAF